MKKKKSNTRRFQASPTNWEMDLVEEMIGKTGATKTEWLSRAIQAIIHHEIVLFDTVVKVNLKTKTVFDK